MADIRTENHTSNTCESEFFYDNGMQQNCPFDLNPSVDLFLFNFLPLQSEQDIQSELQEKQRQLLELKKKKLELELAATQKQLSIVAVAPPPPQSHPTFVDPTKILNTTDVVMRADTLPNVMPVIAKPITAIPPPNFMPAQMPVSNVRTRIAPVNPSMVSCVRLRDPRLARQTPLTTTKPHAMNHTTQPINNHIPPKLSSRK